MKLSTWLPALAASLLLVALVAAPKDKPQTPPRDRIPVVVELFTSEGCSSCPPADKLLTRLAAEQPIAGVEIIPLGQHVDYWNRLGWTDPFSHSRFSQRQQDYSRQRWPGRVYTPQMIVGGIAEFVGSDTGEARTAVENAARQPKAKVQIAIGPASPGHAPISIHIGKLPIQKGRADVILALTEDDLTVNVARGENGGRKLSHSGVVRDWRVIASLDASKDEAFEFSDRISLFPDWDPHNLRAVVFAQQDPMGQILGAASAAIRTGE